MSRGRGGRRRPNQRPTVDGFQPVRISTKAEDSEPEAKRIPLFYIDDVEYTIPVELPPAVGLRYLRDVRDRGYDVAVAELLEEVLGEDGFEALAGSNQVDRQQMGRIVDLVLGIAFGAVDPGKGSSSAPTS